MRIARYTTGDEPAYAVVEGEPGWEVLAAVHGDPLYQDIVFTGERIELDDARLLAPVIPRSKVVAIGRNYADHAAEMGNDVPLTLASTLLQQAENQTALFTLVQQRQNRTP